MAILIYKNQYNFALITAKAMFKCMENFKLFGQVSTELLTISHLFSNTPIPLYTGFLVPQDSSFIHTVMLELFDFSTKSTIT